MLSLCPTTLSPFHLKTLNFNSSPQNANHVTFSLLPLTAVASRSGYETETGFDFEIGDTFFRHESSTRRDLGVLVVALYKKKNDNLQVLGAMCSCGIRSLRYLVEAKVDSVLANDANKECNGVIVSNLSTVSSEEKGRWKVCRCAFDVVKLGGLLYVAVNERVLFQCPSS